MAYHETHSPTDIHRLPFAIGPHVLAGLAMAAICILLAASAPDLVASTGNSSQDIWHGNSASLSVANAAPGAVPFD